MIHVCLPYMPTYTLAIFINDYIIIIQALIIVLIKFPELLMYS
jgi:hypothetical protein